ncbi:MAG: hypothetical protein RR891_02225 [Clostridium sp.]|uniref:hypothetical protein n=1 Tax=Clostridium sp. TaxID=1506 RepID=UPI0030631DC5
MIIRRIKDRYLSRGDKSQIEDEVNRRLEAEEEIRIILEERILDAIEDLVDRNGGVSGLDGQTVSDILSYYIAGDPRFKDKLKNELQRLG